MIKRYKNLQLLYLLWPWPTTWPRHGQHEPDIWVKGHSVGKLYVRTHTQTHSRL